MSASGLPGTGSERVLARVVFPTDGDLDVLPLYVDGQQVPVQSPDEEDEVIPVVFDQSPDQVLDRRRYRLEPGHRASFATYFNAFPAGYWRRWSTLSSVSLRVRTSGPGTLVVYRSTAKGSTARVTSRTVTGSDEHQISLPLKEFGDGGWYWFDLVAAREDLTLEGAEWLAETSAGGESAAYGTVTIGITTFNRPAYCAALLRQLGEDEELRHVLDEVIVVDQGTERVRAHDEYAASAAALGPRLRVLEQHNLGGSGGFARAMLETLDADRSQYVLLLDDDVVCEPEGIARAAAFADLARRPTIVGGHMFSMYQRSVLHAFAECVVPWQFRWEPTAPTVHDHDLSHSNLRSTPWLHRRTDADYNGWWMCLIPVSVLREVGLSLPVFIKWDDAEFGLRAREAGVPTVSLPGAAVWHVPWTDKDDSVDWQAYFHARNRLIAALLHSRFEHGGRIVRESLAIQLKHILAMQYSAGALRQLAVADVLAGPEGLHDQLSTRLADVRGRRQDFIDAQVASDPDDFAPIREGRPRKRDVVSKRPTSRVATLAIALTGLARQVLPVRPGAHDHPEREVQAPDAGWWTLSRLDSALVSTTDGTGTSWHRRDRRAAGDATVAAVRAHQQLLREWPTLAARYRAALPELVGADAWRKTLDLPLRDEAGSVESAAP